jgi:polyhydroxybutyrate depolymerase
MDSRFRPIHQSQTLSRREFFIGNLTRGLSPFSARRQKVHAVTMCVLFGAIVGAACSSSPNAAPTQPASVTATAAAPTAAVSMAPVRPSSGCPGPNPSASGAATETIAVAGAQRTYRRYLPEHTDDRPSPVVIDLHGATFNIDKQVAISAFEAVAARETFIVLTPQGVGTPTNWNFGKEDAANVDVQFITSMLDEVEATACVDTARVYIDGLSSGGSLASVLACLRGDRIAAVGLVSGIRRSDACHPPRPIPMVVFWGKQDVVAPYCGGVGNVALALALNQPLPTPSAPTCPPDNLFGVPPVEQVVGTWASANGCGPNPNVVQMAVDVEERDFGGCDQASAVQFFVIAAGGHNWPGSKVMKEMSNAADGAAFRPVTDAIDATQLMWTFFKGHALTDGTP